MRTTTADIVKRTLKDLQTYPVCSSMEYEVESSERGTDVMIKLSLPTLDVEVDQTFRIFSMFDQRPHKVAPMVTMIVKSYIIKALWNE